MKRDEHPRGPDGRRERWTAHRAVRRAELIEAVVEAARQLGPAVDMDGVSRSSGIAKPVFYRYFADKADLYQAVGREVAERIVGDVVVAVDGQHDARARLAAGIDAFLGHVEAEPELYRFVLRSPASVSAAGDHGQVVGRHGSRLIGELLREAGLDSGAAEPWGFAMVGAVRAAAERWLEDATMSRQALGGYLTDLLWAGCSSAALSPRVPVVGLAGPSGAQPTRGE